MRREKSSVAPAKWCPAGGWRLRPPHLVRGHWGCLAGLRASLCLATDPGFLRLDAIFVASRFFLLNELSFAYKRSCSRLGCAKEGFDPFATPVKGARRLPMAR